MSSYRQRPSRSDRVKAMTAVVAVHAVLGALLAIRPSVGPAPVDQESTLLIDIAPPRPEPEPVKPKADRAKEAEGAAGKKAEPSPIVAPEPRPLPTVQPIQASPVAGTGSAPSAGAASTGSGPGAGGTGSGRGGGGSGGGGIGVEARLLSGGLTRGDYRGIRDLAGSSGRARLSILVGPDGRVARCSIANSSGSENVDAALCEILEPRMRWSPARDRAGTPISVQLYYVATWQRF